jgi:hypothetical protein
LALLLLAADALGLQHSAPGLQQSAAWAATALTVKAAIRPSRLKSLFMVFLL